MQSGDFVILFLWEYHFIFLFCLDLLRISFSLRHFNLRRGRMPCPLCDFLAGHVVFLFSRPFWISEAIHLPSFPFLSPPPPPPPFFPDASGSLLFLFSSRLVVYHFFCPRFRTLFSPVAVCIRKSEFFPLFLLPLLRYPHSS